MGGRRRSIQEYQKMIHEYSKRREFYLKNYGSKDKRYLNCRRQIHNCNRAINRYYKRVEEMKCLVNTINEFIGINVKKKLKGSWQSKEEKVARGIFIKYGMQNGLSGCEIGSFLKMKDIKRFASKYRTNFTRSFKTNEYNKSTYYNFLEFIKRNN